MEQTPSQSAPCRGSSPPRLWLCGREMPLGRRCLWLWSLRLGSTVGVGSQKPSASLGEPAPPVPRAWCIFRSLSALIKTEGISRSLCLLRVSDFTGTESNGDESTQGLERISRSAGNACQAASVLPPFSLAFFEVCSSSAFLLLLPPSPHSPCHTPSTQTFPEHFT